MDLTFSVQQATGTRKTESNYIKLNKNLSKDIKSI